MEKSLPLRQHKDGGVNVAVAVDEVQRRITDRNKVTVYAVVASGMSRCLRIRGTIKTRFIEDICTIHNLIDAEENCFADVVGERLLGNSFHQFRQQDITRICVAIFSVWGASSFPRS